MIIVISRRYLKETTLMREIEEFVVRFIQCGPHKCLIKIHLKDMIAQI